MKETGKMGFGMDMEYSIMQMAQNTKDIGKIT